LIAHRLVGKEAERRGISAQALLEAETRNGEAVTEQEIDAAYRQQKAQLNGDEATAKEQVAGSFTPRRLQAVNAPSSISYVRKPWLSST